LIEPSPSVEEMLDAELALFVAIGFLAQIVDGALGMAFGVIVASALLTLGVSPTAASAAVHATEVVTTGISGASHVWNKNVDRKVFLSLVIAGICGGVLGAYVLTALPEEVVKPFIAVYLAAMASLIGARIAGWSFRRWKPPTPVVGGGGGFLDAVGGGGWGPLVASTLIATGDNPRKTIGSANLAEFFVTTSVSVTFVTQLDLSTYGKIVVGLIIGGAMAAPLAGFLVKKLPPRLVLILVGIVVACLSVLNVAQLFL
jgi:uncharacterized membrane protein YfcA